MNVILSKDPAGIEIHCGQHCDQKNKIGQPEFPEEAAASQFQLRLVHFRFQDVARAANGFQIFRLFRILFYLFA